jgi:hypothetical protein
LGLKILIFFVADPDRKKIDSGSGINPNIPDHISESLVSICGLKKYLYSVFQIRDPVPF